MSAGSTPARPAQRPPAGEWRTFLILAGRGFGKTRSAAEWIRHRVETGQARRIALVGATAADVRDVMVEGPSGILAVCPPWNRPRYEPSKRRLTWPNGAMATTFSAEEPERLRGPQNDCAWIDELAAFPYPSAVDNLLFGLRLGADPRLCVTTTPKPVRLVTELVKDPTTAIVRGTTYENRAHLAASFFDRIATKYEGTRLGQQELLAELLEVSEGVWFASFDPARHVSESAEYDPALPVHLAIDCGVSRHVGAVWFQVRRGRVPVQRTASGWIVQTDPNEPETVTVFGDLHAEGLYSEAAARRILARSQELPCRGRLDTVRLDPASSARTGIGPTAYAEFETGLRPAGPGPLAESPGARRVGPGRGAARSVLPADPPAMLGPESGVPELYPPADVGRRLAGRSGGPAASARGPDGLLAGRDQGSVPRGADRAAAAADRRGGEGVSRRWPPDRGETKTPSTCSDWKCGLPSIFAKNFRGMSDCFPLLLETE